MHEGAIGRKGLKMSFPGRCLMRGAYACGIALTNMSGDIWIWVFAAAGVFLLVG